jgi:hypothetical protein
VNLIRPWLLDIPVRVFIDTDPVFTQIRRIINSTDKELADQHTVFFSFAENICDEKSEIPDDGFPWQVTRQPIVLSAWPVTEGNPNGNFSTMMEWKSYEEQVLNGKFYGMKSESYLPYFDLPQKVSSQLEVAIGGAEAPREELLRNGWIVSNAFERSIDPWIYQRYLQDSKAEFSVAKHGYVIARSGWFSERSAAYLASGRPVVVQETGFSDWMITGKGVIPFRNPVEAIDAIEEVNRNYISHCSSAKEIAEEYFDSQKVLSSLIERSVTSST